MKLGGEVRGRVADPRIAPSKQKPRTISASPVKNPTAPRMIQANKSRGHRRGAYQQGSTGGVELLDADWLASRSPQVRQSGDGRDLRRHAGGQCRIPGVRVEASIPNGKVANRDSQRAFGLGPSATKGQGQWIRGSFGDLETLSNKIGPNRVVARLARTKPVTELARGENWRNGETRDRGRI